MNGNANCVSRFKSWGCLSLKEEIKLSFRLDQDLPKESELPLQNQGFDGPKGTEIFQLGKTQMISYGSNEH